MAFAVMADLDPLVPVTTVSLVGAQFIASQRPFVANIHVPIADDHDLGDLTFEAASRKAKSAVQIAGSIFLNWRASVQRLQSYRSSNDPPVNGHCF